MSNPPNPAEPEEKKDQIGLVYPDNEETANGTSPPRVNEKTTSAVEEADQADVFLCTIEGWSETPDDTDWNKGKEDVLTNKEDEPVEENYTLVHSVVLSNPLRTAQNPKDPSASEANSKTSSTLPRPTEDITFLDPTTTASKTD